MHTKNTKWKKRLAAGILSVAMILSGLTPVSLIGLFGNPVTVYAEPISVTESGITISDLAVSNTNPEYGDVITYSLKVETEKELYGVWISLKGGNGAGSTSQMMVNEDGIVCFDLTLDYFGTYEIIDINVMDVDGNNVYFCNSQCSSSDLMPAEEQMLMVDMSSFNVIVANDPHDTTAPKMTDDAFGTDKDIAYIGETARFYTYITDNDVISSVTFSYKDSNSFYSASMNYDEEEGYYFFDISLPKYGLYEITDIMAEDRCGNKLHVYNNRCSDFDESQVVYEDGVDIVLLDMSAANVTVEGGNPDDTEAPIIDFDTLTVKSDKISLHDTNVISMVINDDSDISEISAFITQGKGGTWGYGSTFGLNEETGLYECELTGNFYGSYEIRSITVTDTNGNSRTYDVDPESNPSEPEEADFSSANFQVGIFDEDTGIYVSGNGMEEDAALSVDVLSEELSIDTYNLLAEDGYTVDSFDEISMSGVYNSDDNQVSVYFPVSDVGDGESVRIRHLLSDNTIQTEEAIVENGFVVIHVDEFSPFLVEHIANGSNPEGIVIDETTFPDEVFRNYVSSELDLDKDGVMSSEECDAVEYIVMDDSDIESLKGIEFFSNLYQLVCRNNTSLKELDVSANSNLHILWCFNNNLEELDLTQNTELTELSCGGNKLSSLDLRNNQNLKKLYCNNNQLSSLDLNNNTMLSAFDADGQALSGIIDENGTLNLVQEYGIDPEKIIYEENDLYQINEGIVHVDSREQCDAVSYTYDCGNDHTMMVTISIQKDIYVSSLYISVPNSCMYLGKTETIYAYLYPDYVTNKELTWTSSDDTVVSVAKDEASPTVATVTALKTGTADITVAATDGSGKSSTATIYVYDDLDYTVDSTELTIGETMTCTPTVDPSEYIDRITGYDGFLEWLSSDESVATVSSTGVITPISEGTVTISCVFPAVYSSDEPWAVVSKEFTVSTPEIPDVTITNLTISNATPIIGETITYTFDMETEVAFGYLCARVKAGNGPEYSLNVTVNEENGVYHCTAQLPEIQYYGTYKLYEIDLYCVNETTVTVYDSVYEAEAYTRPRNAVLFDFSAADAIVDETLVDSIEITNTLPVSIGVEDTLQLNHTVSPSNATNKSVTWESSDEDVATVDANGLVEVIGVGTVTITCTAADGSGVYDTIEIEVKQPENLVETDIPSVPSSDTNEVKAGTNVTSEELLDNVDNSLSEDQQTILNAAMDEGQTLTYRLAIDKLDDGVDVTTEQQAEQEAIREYLRDNDLGYEISDFFDISLGIYGDDATTPLVEVTETRVAIPLIIAIPDELKRAGREFYVLRFHTDETTGEDSISVIPASQNEDGTLSFESSLFSTYALTHVDPEYTVTITNGTANPTTAKTGDLVTITAAGYPATIFKGWESSTDGVSFANASQTTTTFAMPSANVMVNAKYEVQVTFNANGHGTAPAAQTITYNSKANKPGMAKVENYEFVGWYKDQACTQAFDFNTAVTANTTLYASWKACSHSYGAWNITKQATAGNTGLKVHTCTKCGHSESEVIPKVVVAVTGITLNKTGASVDIGKTVVLSASVAPSNASNKNVTWKSSNDSIATVSNSGTVTGKKDGTVTITCTAADGSGKKATCTVTVVNPVIYVSGVSLNKTSTTIAKGSSETLTASIVPSNATNRGVTWSSTNPSVASVNSSGVITALAKGTATIVCTAADGSAKTAVCSITVTDYSPTEAFAARLYEKCLGRNPDLEGLEHWSGLLDRKQRSGAQVAYGFVFSEEYKAKNTTNEEYVDMLYRVFMDREADAGGREHWVNYLNNGMSRGYVFRGFVHSTEYTGICNNYGIVRGEVKLTQARDQNPRLTAYVNRMYTKALGRPGEEDGLNHWCKTIQTKTKTPEQVAESFINSTEFKNKNLSDEDYIKVLYRTFMGREYDEGGLAHWKEELKRGCSREEILHRFATSKEFKNIQADFGL